MAVLWGGTAVAVKFSVERLPPIAVAAMRFGLAALCLFPWCLVAGKSLRLSRPAAAGVLALATLLWSQIATFNYGVEYSNSSHGVILINVFILHVILIEHFVTRTSRITALTGVGVALAMAGLLLTVATTGRAGSSRIPNAASDQPTLLGDLILIASSFLLAVRVVTVKRAVRNVDPVVLVFWQHFVAAVMFAISSWSVGESGVLERANWTMPVVLGLLYQAIVVGTVCFVLQTMLLVRHSASRIAVFSFITPLAGLLFAAVLRDDPLSPWLIVAGLCVAAGIFLTNRG